MLPEKNTATTKGLFSALNAMLGFIAGLVVVVLQVPGVREAVIQYFQNNFLNILTILIAAGLPIGGARFVWNFFQKDVKNY